MVDDHLQYKEEIKRAVREEFRRSYRNISGNIYSITQELLRSTVIDTQN